MQGRRKITPTLQIEDLKCDDEEYNDTNKISLPSLGSTDIMKYFMVPQTMNGLPIEHGEHIPDDLPISLRVRLEDLDPTTQRRLGSGSGGVVYSILHKPSNKLIAFKKIRVTERTRSEICRELSALHYGASPYIIEYFGAYIHDGHMFIFLEYMDYSLDRILSHTGPLPEPVVAAIAVQALRALHYLHQERSLLHRDVKASNFLVSTNGVCKVADFGISKQKDSVMRQSAGTFVGTLLTLSPERLMGAPYGAAADIWSFGLVVYQLATGRHPFARDNDPNPMFSMMAAFEAHRDTGFGLPDGPWSPALRDVVAQCLRVDPNARPTALALLAHPYFADWTPDAARQRVAAFLAEQRVPTAWELGSPVRGSDLPPASAPPAHTATLPPDESDTLGHGNEVGGTPPVGRDPGLASAIRDALQSV